MGNWFTKAINVDRALEEKFMRVRINKKEVESAEAFMNRIFLDNWTENMTHDVSTGIPKDKIDEFGKNLMECLELEPTSTEGRKLIANLKKINISSGPNAINAHAVMEIDFNINDFRSMYGFICAVEQNDGRISIAYAFHSLKFTISLNEMGERVALGLTEIQSIKNSFSRHKALLTLREEGIIPCINYEV